MKQYKKLFGKFSNKYENKLGRIRETTEKESNHLDLYLKIYGQSKFSQILFFKINKRNKKMVRGGKRTLGLRFHLCQRGPARGSLIVDALGPLVRFDQSPASFLLYPSGGEAPAIAVDEQRLPAGF